METDNKPPPPPAYNPNYAYPALPPGALEQQQDYWAKQVPTGYSNQPPVAMAMPPPQPQTGLLVVQGAPATYGTVPAQPQVVYAVVPHYHCAKKRVRTGTGVARVILFIITIIHLALVADMMNNCYNAAYYIPLLILPVSTILHSMGAICMKRCYARRGTCSGLGDIFFALFYVGQGAAILAVYYEIWDHFYKYKPDYWCFVGEDEMSAAAATAFIISIVHFVTGVSICCCHCFSDFPEEEHATLVAYAPPQIAVQPGMVATAAPAVITTAPIYPTIG